MLMSFMAFNLDPRLRGWSLLTARFDLELNGFDMMEAQGIFMVGVLLKYVKSIRAAINKFAFVYV